MIVKTKNYKLEKKIYIQLALKSVLKKARMDCGINSVPACAWVMRYQELKPSGGLLLQSLAWVCIILFWWIQFYGVTQLEQGKMLFEKFSYEISSQQILMKINPREGMPMKWDQIQRATIGKDFYVLYVNKAQIIYWPFKIFNTDNERKFVASILKSKGFVK